MYEKEKNTQEKFISLLKEKIPRHLIATLKEMLSLEKEAIYRRLKGEVSFSFIEMAKLSAHLGISLDHLVGIASPYGTQCHQLYTRDYDEFKQVDLDIGYKYIEAINIAAESSNSEFGVAANILPFHISFLHIPIYRIYWLKWRYQFGTKSKNQLSYSAIQVPESEKKSYQLYLDVVQKIKYTFFIWDSSFFMSLINDINYFNKIGLINREEMQMLKIEMSNLLDTIEHFVNEGKFKETGNKVETYISCLDFENTCTYLYSENIFLSMNNAYNLGAFTSIEKEACENMKKWVEGLKRSSNLISGAALFEKIMFFKKQREILENNFIIQ